jgi:hypothetical protein
MEDQGIDGSMILKRIIKKWCKCVGSLGLGHRPVAGAFASDNKASNFIKGKG